jgi:hypothetical protein
MRKVCMNGAPGEMRGFFAQLRMTSSQVWMTAWWRFWAGEHRLQIMVMAVTLEVCKWAVCLTLDGVTSRVKDDP